MDVSIEVARDAGACFGVERALDMAFEAAEQFSGPVNTLGPLIHNPVVVQALEERGVTVVEAPEVGEGATLLLRTHGVTPDVERAARASGATVIDATCPFVKRVHRHAERLEAEGYQVVIVGEKGHPEVEGTLGHAPSATVVGSAEEAASLEVGRRAGLVVQTTQSESNLRTVVDALVGRVDELRLFDTICEATSTRQAAAADLAERSDVMIVIGGRNSANTTRLAEICAARCPKTHHIETADEIEAAWLADARHIGITAGASTPQTFIKDVRAAIARLVGEQS